jgi:hypothetical protein
MKKYNYFTIVILLIFAYQAANSQSTQAMYYLNFPRSVSSVGLGEQGVTSWNSADALADNPANLIYSKNIELSYFRDPFYSYWGYFPLTSYTTTFQIPGIGYFGFEYLNWNLGDMVITSPSGPEVVNKFSAYQRSFSIGYARDFSEEFAAGIQVRYAQDKFRREEWDKFLFSAGINYNPDIIEKRLSLGFSLTNLGTAVEYDFERTTEQETIQSDPPPSEMKIGAGFLPVKNDYVQLAAYLQLTKLFDERGANWQGQSSFKTLFTDWKEFPRDATVHSGIAFKWLPLDLGGNFSFSQDFYIGNTSSGPKTDFSNFYTHGATVGIGYRGIQASIGYAGWWHNVYRQNYLPLVMPRETFQVTLSVDPDLVLKNAETSKPSGILNKIILSVGSSYTLRTGRAKEEKYFPIALISKNGISYSIESDFYINENSALVSSAVYQCVPIEQYFLTIPIHKSKFENLMFSSSYRIHPLKTFQPLYLQGGLGIIRENPVAPTYPKYDYGTYITAAIGALIELTENIYIKPAFNFTSILSDVSGAAPHLGGYNQFDLTLRLGYRVK